MKRFGLRSNLRWVFVAILALPSCTPNSNPHPHHARIGEDAGILGGEQARGDETFLRSVVAVFNTSGSICTGALVELNGLSQAEVVITAAHCVDAPLSNIELRFGRNALRHYDYVVRKPSRIEIAKQWAERKASMSNRRDLALVFFSGGVPDGFSAVKQARDRAILQDGTKIIVAGYGVSDPKKQSTIGVLRYAATEISVSNWSETEFAIDQSEGRGVCSGDSGGPAFVQVGAEWLLLGIHSRVNSLPSPCSSWGIITSVFQ